METTPRINIDEENADQKGGMIPLFAICFGVFTGI